MNNTEWLTTLYYDIGKQQSDMRLTSTFIDKETGETKFTKWRKYIEAQADESFIQKCNQREQLKNEIILDLDEGNVDDYLKLISILREDGIKFYAYKTKEGRARHIHTFWKNLATIPKKDREQIRTRFIKKYHCDLSLKSDAHVIPIEFQKHWKTSQLKELISEEPGFNEAKYFVEEIEAERQLNQSSKVTLTGLQIDNFLDNVKVFREQQPFFYDKNLMYWFWNHTEYKWEMVDETDIMIGIEKQLQLYGQTIKPSIKQQYLEAIKRVGREHKPKDAPAKWVQFKNKAYSLKSKKLHDVTPDYFFTNPIPWEIGTSYETPTLDKLFSEWVGEENIEVLYELLAYSCYTKYPISLIFCLVGSGRNGKSKYLTILNNFCGWVVLGDIRNC